MNRRPLCLSLTLLLLAGLLAATAAAEEIHRELTFAGKQLHIANMIGHVDVREGAGDDFRVQVFIRGEDVAEDLVKLVVDPSGDELVIEFPVKDHRKYVYPALGRDSHSRITYRNQSPQEGSWLRKIFGGLGGDQISVRGRGNGLEVWADVLVEVPARGSLKVKLGVGSIEGESLHADVDLDTHSGSIAVADLVGDLRADTGSGRVTAERIEGEVNIDTGSGSVEVSDCRGREVLVDTGSGHVDADRIDCDKLYIDTGSGRVHASAVTCDRAKIDTGSGAVELELDGMGEGRFVIDTGSGSIRLELPADASAHITADTGSGGIRNEVENAKVVRKDRDEMILVVGGGSAEVVLDAGSGSITVSQK